MSGRHRTPDAADHDRHSDPIADPSASSTNSSSSLANGGFRAELPTNDGVPRDTTTQERRQHRKHVTASIVAEISGRLSERDYAILRSVDQHQFLATGHIETFHFAHVAPNARGRVTRRALARLRDLRIIVMLQHTIGGVRAGSQGKVYGVDIVGDRLLRNLVRGGARVRGLQEPSLRFLNHRLAIADCHATLVAADRTRQIELTDSAVEPASWRTFTGTGGTRLMLKPDLYVETATADDLVHAWFLEIDLGTESIPTLLRKCRDYETYRRSGLEQDRHGSFPLVIWSMTHHDPAKAQRRRQALAEAIAADRNLPDVLFRIVAPEQLLPLIQQGAAR
ncbi:replication-relaxation family protein [Mycobacteroides abscessus]|uniref:replication-relaxation family protein n=1 Tax=Mycobacteroides abscessus TaxID=36809 RepID=UPI000C25EB1D|nr:replication-relaxation family protein [Mycobacteroides abscessus]